MVNVCSDCKKDIPNGVLHYTICEHLERYDGESIEVIEAKTINMRCIKCRDKDLPTFAKEGKLDQKKENE